jgi:uncharacterized glyoxalase superfamily protein PhnB
MRALAPVLLTLVSCAALAQTPAMQSNPPKKEIVMSVNKITPVLLVEEVEPCIDFWVNRLGFRKTIEVPDGNKIGFVALQKGNLELMYQSFASVAKDDPNRTDVMRKGPTFLYVEVDNLDETIAALRGAPVVMPERTTFYGSKEIGVTDPGGHVITFAQMAAVPAHN